MTIFLVAIILVLSRRRLGEFTENSIDPGGKIEKCNLDSAIEHVLDFTNGLSTILQDRSGDGSLQNHYIHAPDGLGWKLDDQGEAQFYHFDYLGHTLALSDADGELTDAYAHDAFGDFMTHIGETNQPFTWLGKYGIEHEGDAHYHIRAREYDATQGRFWSKDVAPMEAGTQGSNKYVYGMNNPYSYMDVNGLQAQTTNPAYAAAGFAPMFTATQTTYEYESGPETVIEHVQQVNNANSYTETNPDRCREQKAAIYWESFRSHMAESASEFAGGFKDGLDFLLLDDVEGCFVDGDAVDCAWLTFNFVGVAKVAKTISITRKTTRGIVYTKSSLKLGQQMHKAYKAGLHNPAKGLYKEFTGVKGLRPDFVDFNKRIIYELKPNNPRQIKAGWNQLNKYKSAFESQYGGTWKTVLDLY